MESSHDNGCRDGTIYLFAPHLNDTILHGQRAQVPALMSLVHRVLPFLPVNLVTTEELWLKRPDVEGIQEVGYIPATAPVDPTASPDAHLEQVQRSKDGKQVSFIFHGMLYILPINPTK